MEKLTPCTKFHLFFPFYSLPEGSETHLKGNRKRNSSVTNPRRGTSTWICYGAVASQFGMRLGEGALKAEYQHACRRYLRSAYQHLGTFGQRESIRRVAVVQHNA